MPWTIFYVRRVHAGFNQRCRHQRLDFVRVKIRHGFFLVRRRGKKFFTAAESATFPDMVVPQTCPDQNRFRTVRDWCLRHPRWMLTLLTVVSLAPFLAKPLKDLVIPNEPRSGAAPGSPSGAQRIPDSSLRSLPG